MTTVCERCKREIYRTETCNYCGRKIGTECIKASQRANKITRLVICKDDWSKLAVRAMYKNKQAPALAAKPAKA
ncbi:MAG: hypothetical protein LVQ95_00185 [Candidatus Micrarchaeales archaeon]|nr:hypothetical protein [Candidatus Micrarchaeales archaeon]